jgi:hypothetical protein
MFEQIFIAAPVASENETRVKPVYDDHPGDPKIVAFVDRWSLFRGCLCNKCSNLDLKMVVVIDRFECIFKSNYKIIVTIHQSKSLSYSETVKI